MEGKTCLVTGATSGIGEATALGLAELGARVIIAGRSRTRCEATQERIQAATGNEVAFLLADLSEMDQVRRLASEVRDRTARLDVLVNNAGAFFLRRKLSPDGFEMTFALNHLSYFVLTNKLLSLLISSSPARVVNVSSSTHYQGEIDFDNLQLQRGYSGQKAYAQSKLCNVLFTKELARRHSEDGIITNALHPGFIHTRIGQNNGFLSKIFVPLVFRNGRSPQKGAETVIYLAGAQEATEVVGEYFYNLKPKTPAKLAMDAELAAQLWRTSEQLTESTAKAANDAMVP